VTPSIVIPQAPPTEHSVKVAGGRWITASQLARYNGLIALGYGGSDHGFLPPLKKDDGVQPVPREDGRYFIDDAHAQYFERMNLLYESKIKP
jgi:hypothetical protein